MIHNLFSVPIFKENIGHLINADSIRCAISPLFDDGKEHNVELEKNGGVSTYAVNRQLHEIPALTELVTQVMKRVRVFWNILDVNKGLVPKIDECWSNLHPTGGFTDTHSHSLMPVVVSFYLSAPENSGGIVFTNPMEYSLSHIPYNDPIEGKTETTVKVETGDILLFPGYLRHKTQVNYSDQDRIVITFNIRPEGIYLDSSSEYPIIKTNLVSESNDVDEFTVNTDIGSIDLLVNKLYNQELIIEELTSFISGDKNER